MIMTLHCILAHLGFIWLLFEVYFFSLLPVFTFTALRGCLLYYTGHLKAFLLIKLSLYSDFFFSSGDALLMRVVFSMIFCLMGVLLFTWGLSALP